jgi:hypothetical protein
MKSSCEKKQTNPGGTRTFCSAINCPNSKLKNPDDKRYYVMIKGAMKIKQ